jgi:hypothetical protein
MMTVQDGSPGTMSDIGMGVFVFVWTRECDPPSDQDPLHVAGFAWLPKQVGRHV